MRLRFTENKIKWDKITVKSEIFFHRNVHVQIDMLIICISRNKFGQTVRVLNSLK